jgi:hypothetical protein
MVFKHIYIGTVNSLLRFLDSALACRTPLVNTRSLILPRYHVKQFMGLYGPHDAVDACVEESLFFPSLF